MHIITNLADGGAQAILHRLCSHDNSNVHFIVSLMDLGKYGEDLRRIGVKVFCLDMPRGGISVRGLFALYKYVKDLRPDVVQTWMYHGDLIGGVCARLAGVRGVIWGVHNTMLDPSYTKLSTLFVAKLNAFVSHFVPAKILFCASSSAAYHRHLGFDSKKIAVVNNGYDLGHFSRDDYSREVVRRNLMVNDGVPLLGMVARFDPIKDHENLLKSLALVRGCGFSFKCILVGVDMDGENSFLVDMINSYGLFDSVILHGQTSDIPGIMNAIDVHVLSSKSEAFPNVVNEAMACGTPCITTDVGDAAYIVGDTGWIVPPSDSSLLAQAIIKALEAIDDSSSWQDRCNAARARVADHFSLESMIRGYHSVWNEAAVEPPSPDALTRK